MLRAAALVLAVGAAATTAAAAAIPACQNLAVSLKAPKQVATGGSAAVVFTIKNTGSSAVGPLAVSLNTPANFQRPHITAVRPKAKPALAAPTYSAPSTVWRGVTVAPGKALRFAIKARANKCKPATTTLAFGGAAFKVDAANASNILCLSTAASAGTLKVKAHSASPCPAPAPGPGNTVLIATNQAFVGAVFPNNRRRRRLEEENGKNGGVRILGTQQATLEACSTACKTETNNASPLSVVYNADTLDCGCCTTPTDCGPLINLPGYNTYAVVSPSPSPGPGPGPAPAPPTRLPTGAPNVPPGPLFTQCKTGELCVTGTDVGPILGPPDLCFAACTTASASNQYFAQNTFDGQCLCSTTATTCTVDGDWNTYAIGTATCSI